MTSDSQTPENSPQHEEIPKNQSSIAVMGCFVFLILSVCVLVGVGGVLLLVFRGEQRRLEEHNTIEIQRRILEEEAQSEREKALEAKIRRDQLVALEVEMKRKKVEVEAIKAARLKEAKALAAAAKKAAGEDTEAKRVAREAEQKRLREEGIKKAGAVDRQKTMLRVVQGNLKLGLLPRLGVSVAQQREISKRLELLVTDFANKKARISKLKRVLAILDKIVSTQSFSEQAYKELDAELKRSS